MAQTTKFTNITAYKWLDPSKFKGVAQYGPEQLASWKAKGPGTNAYKNYKYYSPGGAGYQEAMTDWAIGETEKYLTQHPEMGVSATQLLTNPSLYQDPQALAKYTGKPYGGVDYTPGSADWYKLHPEEQPGGQVLGSLSTPTTGGIPSQTYTVESGDTLSGIAAKLGVPMSSISGYRSGDPNLIYPGEQLSVGGGKSVDLTAPVIDSITGDSITESQSINIEPPKVPSNTEGGTIDSADIVVKSIDDYIKIITGETTEKQQEESDLLKRMNELLGEAGGRTAMLATEEEKRGVNAIAEQLKNIQNEIMIKNAAFKKLYAEIEGKPITMDSIIGAKAQARKVAQADIEFLLAQSMALQNNLTFAQEQAQRAVDTKYGPIEEELKIKTAQLELVQGQLTKEETIRANALTMYYNDQAAAIADKKAAEKQWSNWLLTQMNKYPSAGITFKDNEATVRSKILSSAEYKEAFTETPSPEKEIVDEGIKRTNAQILKVMGLTGKNQEEVAEMSGDEFAKHLYGEEEVEQYIDEEYIKEELGNRLNVKKVLKSAGVAGFWIGQEKEYNNLLKNLTTFVEIWRTAGYNDDEIWEQIIKKLEGWE